MLELDARTGSCGLAKFQDRIYEHAIQISTVMNQLYGQPGPYSQPLLPAQKIYSRLSEDTLSGLRELGDLAEEMRDYYARPELMCESR